MAPKARTDQDLVFEALDAEVEEGAGDKSRFMLRDALPFALSGGEQCHAYQTEVLRLVDSHLVALADKARDAMEERRKDIEAHRAEVADAEMSVSVEAEAYDKSVEDAHMCDAAVSDLNEKVGVEDQRYKDTIRSTQHLISSMEKLQAEQVDVKELLESLQVEGALPQSTVDNAMDFLKMDDGSEKALIAAAQAALLVEPHEAHEFDIIVKDAVVNAVSDKLHSLNAEIAQSSQSVSFAKAENLGAWAIWQCSEDKLAAAQAASVAANERQAEFREAKRAAKMHFEGQRSHLSALLIEETLAELKLKEIGEAHAAFNRMRHPPPAMPPVADGPVLDDAPCPMQVS